MLKVAILDDYENLALKVADWSKFRPSSEIETFTRHLGEGEAASILRGFDVICTMRERMTISFGLLQCLPNLKSIMIVGPRVANVDVEAASRHGVTIVSTRYEAPAMLEASTPELAWGLILSSVRNISRENRALRAHVWCPTPGFILEGRTLGLLGLGMLGKRMVRYAEAFGMEVIAWSQNLTRDAAAAAGARWVDKDTLFRESDVVSVHLRLSERSIGMVGRRELQLMQRHAHIINTSRARIVDEDALIQALRDGTIAGAGLDVFNAEPLPAAHPFLTIDNVTITPHIGYGTLETLSSVYRGLPPTLHGFLSGDNVDVENPEVLFAGNCRVNRPWPF